MNHISATTIMGDYSVTGENQQAIRLPTAEEYRALIDDPDIYWCFDEDGFPIGGVMRAKHSKKHGVKALAAIAD